MSPCSACVDLDAGLFLNCDPLTLSMHPMSTKTDPPSSRAVLLTKVDRSRVTFPRWILIAPPLPTIITTPSSNTLLYDLHATFAERTPARHSLDDLNATLNSEMHIITTPSLARPSSDLESYALPAPHTTLRG